MKAVGVGYDVVPYDDRYRADVLKLRTIFWGIAEEWNEAHFHWQQEQNPCFEGHLIYLALQQGEVVAMRVLQEAEWEAGLVPTRFRAPCFAGTAILPEHRNRGLFGLLTRFAETDLAKRGYSYVFNLSAGPATYVSSLAEGWRAIGSLRPLIRSSLITGEGLLHRGARTLVRMATSPRRRAGGARIAKELRYEEAARLSAEGPWDGRIRPVQSEAYLRWRFRDPSSRYVFLHLCQDRQLRGYVALQRRAPPLSAGPLHIADWKLANLLRWESLIGACIRYSEGVQIPIAIWSATLADSQQRWLRESGFHDMENRGPLGRSLPTVLVKKLGHEPDSVEWEVAGHRIDQSGGWDLRMICSDPF